MKKYILSILLICFIVIPTFAQNKYVLHISTPSYANGTKLYVNIMDNDKRKILKRDTAIINNQFLTLSGSLTQPSSFVNFYVRQNKGYSMATMVIDTGINNFVLKGLSDKDKPNPLLDISALDSKSNQIKLGTDSIISFYYDKIGKTDKKGITTLSKETMLTMNLKLINYLKAYPSAYFSLIALYEVSQYHRGSVYTNTVLDALKTFDPTLQNSDFGKKFKEEKLEYLRNLTTAKLGGVVPGFTVSDLSGKLFDNGSLRGQNYVIVFSATWCGPCQKSLPEIKELYEKYKSKGLKVVYFNLDDDVIAWRKHVAKNKLTWINVSERVKSSDSKIIKKFNVYSIPSYFVVDKTSTIIHNSVEFGANDVDLLKKSLEKLYNETK